MHDFQIEAFNRLTWEWNYFDIPNWILGKAKNKYCNSISMFTETSSIKNLCQENETLSRIVAFRTWVLQNTTVICSIVRALSISRGNPNPPLFKNVRMHRYRISSHSPASIVLAYFQTYVMSTRLFSLFLIVLVCFVCCLLFGWSAIVEFSIVRRI